MSSSGAQMRNPQSKPYAPTTAGLGLIPTKHVDDPITAVFLLLFILGAATHMIILQVNLRRGKKFIMSGMLFGFCMARITTCIMRIVWTSYIHNVQIAIAAQIFVAAGVLLIFVINLIFTQRVIRATHPGWAWSKPFSLVFQVYYASIVCMLVALIFCTVQSFYTLDKNIRRIDRDVQRVGGVYFAVAAFLPIPLLALNFIIPRRSPIERFGEGRFRSKVMVLLFSSVILTFGAAFRAGISFVPRPRDNPAWYHSKACFYVINFGIEIVVVALYAIIRVDKRFHVPDNSHGPGDFTRKVGEKERRTSFADRIADEEETFDDLRREGRNVDVEKGHEADAISAVPSAKSQTHLKPNHALVEGDDQHDTARGVEEKM